MTTHIYLIRHCEPNYDNHDDFSRELTDKGLQDRQLIVNFFNELTIDNIFSSPYKRAVDTIDPLAKAKALDIKIIPEFRERKIDSVWIEDFTAFSKAQWHDFSYKLSDGESLQEVQNRNITALNNILENNHQQTIAISSHGTAISTIMNHYLNTFGYREFNQLKSLMPFIIEMSFENKSCLSINLYNPFTKQYQTLK